MLDLHMWNVITDMSLAIAVVVLCTRLLASKNIATRRAYALELSLRELIKEADAASKGFTDELQRRQQELHRLLSELRQQEQRLMQVNDQIRSRSARSAEVHADVAPIQTHERPQQTQERVEAARVRQYQNEYVERVQEESRQEEQRAQAPKAAPAPRRKDPVQEPPSFSRNKRSLSRHVERIHEGSHTEDKPAVNIYGEPIPSPTSQASTAYQAPQEEAPLTQNEQSAIQELYDRAESMLRAGSDLQSVASVTRLSMEEVRLLSQMVSREASVDSEYAFEKGIKNGMNLTV